MSNIFSSTYKKLRDIVGGHSAYMTDDAVELIDCLSEAHEKQVSALQRDNYYLETKLNRKETEIIALQELANKVVVNRRPATNATEMNKTIFERNDYETKLYDAQNTISVMRSNILGLENENELLKKECGAAYLKSSKTVELMRENEQLKSQLHTAARRGDDHYPVVGSLFVGYQSTVTHGMKCFYKVPYIPKLIELLATVDEAAKNVDPIRIMEILKNKCL